MVKLARPGNVFCSRNYPTWPFILALMVFSMMVILSSKKHIEESGPVVESLFQIREPLSDKLDCDYTRYILGKGAEQNDKCLVDLVRFQWMVPPSREEYNMTLRGDGSDDIPSNKEKVQIVNELLGDDPKTPKFFIDCGANDGQYNSATFTLEKKYHWTGLLVEGNPIEFQRLLARHRKAFAIEAAACITPYAEHVTFYTNPIESELAGMTKIPERGVTQKLDVQCIPLWTMLQALNVTEVDFLSLDTEGTEMDILKTIPFDKVIFKFLSIEHEHVPGGRQTLQDFMEGKGYIFLKEIHDDHTQDSAFVHESLKWKARKVRLGEK